MNEARRWQALEMLTLMVSTAHGMMQLADKLAQSDEMAQDVDLEVANHILAARHHLELAEKMLHQEGDE